MKKYLIFVIIILLFSCSEPTEPIDDINKFSEYYVILVLATGQYDDNFVDAYFGPERLQKSADSIKYGLDSLIRKANCLKSKLENYNTTPFDKLKLMRHKHLTVMTNSLIAHLNHLNGENLNFDQQAEMIYNCHPPHYSYEHFDSILVQLDSIIPGEGNLRERFVEFQKNFIIPPDSLNSVFMAAINEGRKRTAEYISLPEKDSFVIEYVEDKPWAAYNWYKGDNFSLIEVNTDVDVYIDRAVGLACHEGYPGHHVYHSLLDRKFVDEYGWIEFSIYPLFSPMAVISEGTANYGISLAFPEDERIKFEKDVLFPLAGLDTSNVELYYEINKLRSKMSFVSNEVARDYLSNKISREEARELLMKYQLRKSSRADKYLDFIDTYGAYVLTYNYGEELVKNYVESRAKDHKEKWQVFNKLLITPVVPEELE